LVMSFAIAMFMRDTAFKFRQQGIDLAKAALNNLNKTSVNYTGVYSRTGGVKNPYQIENPYGGKEDIKWLL